MTPGRSEFVLVLFTTKSVHYNKRQTRVQCLLFIVQLGCQFVMSRVASKIEGSVMPNLVKPTGPTARNLAEL